MPVVEVKIWLALKSRIDTLPLDFAKAWPAETFDVPHTNGQLQPYIRVGAVTVDPVPIFIDYGKRHARTGTLIVTLVHPILPGAQASYYSQIAGKVAEHFADGTRMGYYDVCVTVTSQPHVQPGYEDNGYWTTPVTIPWRAYA